MTFKQIIQESDDLFDDLINPPLMVKNQKDEVYSCLYCGIKPEAIKSFIHARDKKLLEGVREVVESKRRVVLGYGISTDLDTVTLDADYKHYYNDALDDIIKALE